jgi:hypothetical protein
MRSLVHTGAVCTLMSTPVRVIGIPEKLLCMRAPVVNA